MQPNILGDLAAKAPWSVIHPLSEEDSAAVAALRAVVAPMKGKFAGIAGRGSGRPDGRYRPAPLGTMAERNILISNQVLSTASFPRAHCRLSPRSRFGSALLFLMYGRYDWRPKGTAISQDCPPRSKQLRSGRLQGKVCSIRVDRQPRRQHAECAG